MSDFINLSDVKKLLDDCIIVIEELYEEHGTQGEFELCEQFSLDLKKFKEGRENLSQYRNSDISAIAIRSVINECIKTISIDELVFYIDSNKMRKEHEIDCIQNQLFMQNLIREAVVKKGEI